MTESWSGRAALAALVVAAMVSAGGVAAAPPGGGCGAGGPGGPGGLEHLEHGVARAGLPPETAQAVYQRIDQARAEQRSIEASLAAAHEQMRTLLDQDAPSADAVLAQADAIGALETQMHKLGLRTMLQVRALLTPEQWDSLMPKRRGPPPAESSAPRS